MSSRRIFCDSFQCGLSEAAGDSRCNGCSIFFEFLSQFYFGVFFGTNFAARCAGRTSPVAAVSLEIEISTAGPLIDHQPQRFGPHFGIRPVLDQSESMGSLGIIRIIFDRLWNGLACPPTAGSPPPPGPAWPVRVAASVWLATVTTLAQVLNSTVTAPIT